MAKRDAYLARVTLGLPTEQTRLTVGRQLAAWLASKRGTVRPSTWASYELHVRYLEPLSRIGLARLTPDDVRRHMRTMLTTPDAAGGTLSPASVNSNRRVLAMALKQAVDDGLIVRNVTASVRSLKTTRYEPRILSATEIRRFIAAAGAAGADGALWTLMLGTGLRLGEALALRWSDVAGESLSVSGSITTTRRPARKPGEKRTNRAEPKTEAGRRTIALPAFAVAALRAHRASLKVIPLPSAYIFPTPRGTPMDGTNVYHRWRDFLDKHNLPRLRQHDLRHTAASLLLANGAGMDDVMRHLGHSSISITVGTYGHLVEGRSAQVAAILDRAIGGK